MTDPVFGDHPFDPLEWWNETFRPPLLTDPEWVILRNVQVAAMREVLESQWLTRWRRALATAEGAQLDARGDELKYLRPDGWTDDRYRDLLIGLSAASYSRRTSQVAFNLASALIYPPQTFTFVNEFPLTARIIFLETDNDDASAYRSAMERARPRGAQFFVVNHPGPAPFTIGLSQIDGPDTLAEINLVPPAKV